MNEKYASILYRQHYKSKKRKSMSMIDRAAQFGSFAALTGHGDMIKEKGRLVDSKIILNEEEIFDLNDKLNFICDNIYSLPLCEITYFIPDLKKDGGMYITQNVKIKKADLINRFLETDNKKKILIDDIMKIVIDSLT